MKKYKLIKEYPESPELGTIVYQYIHLNDIGYSRKDILDFKGFNQELIENNSEYWQEIKPLFYTEDYKDDSFPVKGCNTCIHDDIIVNNICHTCMCKYTGYDNWQGTLKGEPIYEDDKCWTINDTIVNAYGFIFNIKLYHEHTTDIFDNNLDNTTKTFSNETNAKTYYNQLKWQDKLKFKVGDIIQSTISMLTATIDEIDYYNEKYIITTIGTDKKSHTWFNEQDKCVLYELEVGKWYEYTPTKVIALYTGKTESIAGFDWHGNWNPGFMIYNGEIQRGDWKPADMNKVRELLSKEVHRRYKVGDKINCVLGMGQSTVKFIENVKCSADCLIYSDEYNIVIYLYYNGQWAEVLKPKFTTADGINKYEGDKYYKIRDGKPLLREVGKICNMVSDMANYTWDKLENCQQYLAEQIAKKRGIEIGTKVFANNTKKYDGVISSIWYDDEEVIVKSKDGNNGNYNIKQLLTIKELAKEEELEIGTKIPGMLIHDWAEYNRTYDHKIVFEDEPDTKVRDIILCGEPIIIIDNGRWLKIIGFKKFRKEWEEKQRIKDTIEIEVPEGYKYIGEETNNFNQHHTADKGTMLYWKKK